MEFCNTFKYIYGPENCTINMHLHGHLRQCIEDFGPVYSFWCFSFERLNGILGSYHTNSHHISVQLARRFLESKIYAPQNWPIEFTPEYLPLLQRFNYMKGSLRHTTLDNEVSCATNDNICPLPPLKECAFLPHELEELQALLCSQVCILHYRCSAIMLKVQNTASNVVGAKHSRHSQSSLLLCQRNDSEDIGLAEVLFFVRCNVKSGSGEKPTWMAAVSWYMPHNCSVWFGKPTQVWTTTQYPGYCFVPVSHIKSRVVYTKASVNFGRMIGLDTVYVIVPLDM